MEFTKSEKKLLVEAEKYTTNTWRDKLGVLAVLCWVVLGLFWVIEGGVNTYHQKDGLAAISIGGLQIGFACMLYGFYTYRKQSLQLIQKLQSLQSASEE